LRSATAADAGSVVAINFAVLLDDSADPLDEISHCQI
jgi:hypothetical protein